MKQLPKEKRDKIIMIAVATVVACGALWYFVIDAQYDAIKDRETKIAQAQQDVENATRLVKQSPKIEENLEKVSDRMRQMEDTMAQGDMYSWIIKTMNKFLVNYRVEIPT